MKKPRNILLVYVDGANLHDVAAGLEARFQEFAAKRVWSAQEVAVINQQRPPDPGDGPDDLPPWELGLNFTLPDKNEKTGGWIDDVRATVAFLVQMHSEFNRDFVLAVHDRVRGFNEDVSFVDSTTPDLATICRMIDVHRV